MPDNRIIYKVINVIGKLSKYKTTVMTMAVVVVFITTYMLILPALTLEKTEAQKQGGIDVPLAETPEDSLPDEIIDIDSDKIEEPSEDSVTDASDDPDAGEQTDSEPELSDPVSSEVDEAQPSVIDMPDSIMPAMEGSSENADDPLSFEGENYKVSVTDDAGVLPEGTSISVEKIDEKDNTEEYDKYYKETLSALQNEEGGERIKDIAFVSFYDIFLMSDDMEIEPSEGDKVNVKIEFDKDAGNEFTVEDSDNVRIVHFTEDEKTGELATEVLDAEENSVQVDTDGRDLLRSTEFETDSFSVYAVVYTVDFHWEANGNTYDFSIPGGGFVSFSQLVEILGITDSDVKEFVADIEMIEFSDPSLLWTGKAESKTSVREIKDRNGLICEYNPELTEEQIAEIDSRTVEAGDWALISLKPFDTEESLTITMTNGDIWMLRVTDANENARKASLISAASISDGQQLVIYQKVIQKVTHSDGSIENIILYYAIDGNGQLQRVYNSSDSVYWLNGPPIKWRVTELKDNGVPTGYYTLYNEDTGTYLVPKDDNGNYSVVHRLSDFPDADTKHLNVSLPGKDAGNYLSKIASWDYVDNTTYGIEVTSATDVHAKELLSSQDFYFAAPDDIIQGRLTTVDTVDSLSKGITITMYDFEGDEWQIDPTPRYSYMTRIIGDSSYTEGRYHPGLVKPVLGTDGFPVSAETNQSIRPVFETRGNYNYYSDSPNSWDTPGTFNYSVSKTDNVNHLFLQSVYDATGYFYYSCFENYAQLVGNSFKVYEQLGTPWDGDEFFFNRGNFTPYDALDLNHAKTNDFSSSSGSELGMDNPRRGEDLYVIENNGADYYFGMIMEADFIQGPNGYNDRDEPTVFEFNGDDDLWIFIDNVLVLDIGGVHDAFKGTIDFSEGSVIVEGGNSTTIKDMYRNAGLFPDGTQYNESRASEYFSGNTFKDYSTHSFKMFYMERGAAASNLEIKFNLMPVQGSQFRVTKQMPETSSHDVILNDYADAIFYYNAYIGNDICTRQQFGSTAKYADGTPVIWKDNNTFQLKHGQTAIFPVDSNTVRYHVVEIEPEPGSSMLGHYNVTNTDPEPGQQAGKETESAEKSVQQRGEVIYNNRPDDSIVNELRITKNLTGEMYTDDDGNLLVNEETGSPYFEYRVYLENTAGKMVYYSLGEYYQTDISGNYVYYEKGVRKTAVYENGEYVYTYDNGTVERLDAPKITEHTSQNGTIGDIRHGDTIIIRGLLEGTDFAVDERTDRSLMLKGTEGEDQANKYSFDGTDVQDAYIRATGENAPDYPTGTLYDLPAPPDWPYSSKAAEGTIIQNVDAKVTVRNSTIILKADTSLLKKTQDGDPLPGATFKLIKGSEIVPVSASGDGVIVAPLEEGETVTFADNTFSVPAGGVSIQNIPSDNQEYTLIEVSAPEGYVITDPEVATFTVQDGVIVIGSLAETTGARIKFENNVFTVPNTPGVALPNAGGIGTTIFYILGAILVLGCGVCLIARRRILR